MRCITKCISKRVKNIIKQSESHRSSNKCKKRIYCKEDIQYETIKNNIQYCKKVHDLEAYKDKIYKKLNKSKIKISSKQKSVFRQM